VKNQDVSKIAKIAEKFSTEGLLLKKEALDILSSRSDEFSDINELIRIIVHEINKGQGRFVDSHHILSAIESYRELNEKDKNTSGGTGFSLRAEAKDIEEDLKVISGNNVAFELYDEVEKHTEYFRNRFDSMYKIIKKRLDMTSSISLKEASSLNDGQRAKLVVLIKEKRNATLHVEDMISLGQVHLPKNADSSLKRKFESLIPDVVVGIWIVKIHGFLLCEDIIYPDVPDSRPRKSDKRVAAVLISDLHVGSKYFMERSFLNFLRWLKGEVGDSKSQESASKVKYVVLAGDVVDGIGIYPNQNKELEIKTSTGQYEKAADLLSGIPDHIKLIVIPGNHDLTRKALPQPPISKEEGRILSDACNITLLGNPAVVSLHGVVFQIYHGQSIEDLVTLVPNMSHDRPDNAMEFLLKVRHIAPFYGGKTQLQATGNDYLVIGEKPDVFHAGHVHIFGAKSYRGVSIVNSGTWQSTTPYQEMLGLKPTPGIFAVYHLDTSLLNRMRIEEIT